MRGLVTRGRCHTASQLASPNNSRRGKIGGVWWPATGRKTTRSRDVKHAQHARRLLLRIVPYIGLLIGVYPATPVRLRSKFAKRIHHSLSRPTHRSTVRRIRQRHTTHRRAH